MKSKLEEYYNILRSGLSARANHILEYNQLSDPNKVIGCLIDRNKIQLLRNCGKKTAEEIYEMVCNLKEYALTHSPINEEEQDLKQEQILVNDDLTDFQEQYNVMLTSLSTRTYNIAKVQGLLSVKNFKQYLQADETIFLGFRNCGRKSAQEFVDLASRVNSLCMSRANEEFPNPGNAHHVRDHTECLLQANDEFPNPGNAHLSIDEYNFIISFRKTYAHWPMIFLLERFITSGLSQYERMVLDCPDQHKELATLSKSKVHHLFERAVEKIKMSQILNHPDWNYYVAGEFPSLITYPLDELPFIKEWQIEIEELENTSISLSHLESDKVPIILQLFGMTHYMIDNAKKQIVLCNQWQQVGDTSIFIASPYISFKFNKALKEVGRLQSIKTTEDIVIPIDSYYVKNSSYWRGYEKQTERDIVNMSAILNELFQIVCDAEIENRCLKIRANKIDYSNLLYNILKVEGARLHRDELLGRIHNLCEEKGINCTCTTSSQLITFLTKDPRIIPIGKSGYWGLKEWGEIAGGIRTIAKTTLQDSREPIQIDVLADTILRYRADSTLDSIRTIIRQSTYIGEMVLFFDDYIGLKDKKYDRKYVVFPTTFDEWVGAFRQFVQENRRFPYSNQKGYEGYLYRWYYKSSQLINLSSEEILKFDMLGKELAHYPQNATEYNFLQNCNLYQRFVDGNKRMLTAKDDPQLFGWFYNASHSYSTFTDNRRKYFGQLLQSLSSLLYE